MKKNVIVMLVGFALSIIAICLIGLPGLVQSSNGIEASIALAGLMFGNGSINASANGISIGMSYNGGLSFFGLFSFIALLVGIVLVAVRIVLSFMKKGDQKVLSKVGGALMIIAGAFIFLITIVGTDASISAQGVSSPAVSFSEFVKDTALGVGTWLYAIFAILAGGAVLASDFIKD